MKVLAGTLDGKGLLLLLEVLLEVLLLHALPCSVAKPPFAVAALECTP